MSLKLNSLVRKCDTCLWTGDSWDTICQVDKSHTTSKKWAYLDTETMRYEYHDSNLLGD